MRTLKDCETCKYPEGYPFDKEGCSGNQGLGCIGEGTRCCLELFAERDKLNEILNRVHSIQKEEDVPMVFRKIAEDLFTRCIIKQGDVTFRFLEIEFYFYSSAHPDDFVYERKCDRAGTFLIHSSGVDICFKNTNDSYGGILLRHLLRIDNKGEKSVVAGPWDCCDALFNYTGSGNSSILSLAPQPFENVKISTNIRYNAKENFADREYCFYDSHFKFSKAETWGEEETFPRYDPTMRTTSRNNYTTLPWKQRILKIK